MRTPLLLDETGVCELLSIRKSQLRRLIAKGLLPAGRDIGEALVRWHVDEVRSYYARMFALSDANLIETSQQKIANDALNAFAPGRRDRASARSAGSQGR